MTRLKRIHDCFTRALSTYDSEAKAQQQISERLVSMWSESEAIHSQCILEIGCGTGYLTRLLRSRCPQAEYVANDLCENCRQCIESLSPSHPIRFLAGDAERIDFSGQFDLVVSASAFQWMQNLPSFFRKLADFLTTGGTLLFNTFLPDNLHEIRSLTGRGLTYHPEKDILTWLKVAGFDLKQLEEEIICLTFSSPLEVLRHLKATGVTATDGSVWTKGDLERFNKQYIEQFGTSDNCVTLTYHPLYLAAKK